MSTCIISLKTLTSHTTLKAPSLRRRRYCHAAVAATASPPPMQHIQMLGQSQLQNVVVLESHFTPPTTKHKIDDSPRLGTGFFLFATSIPSVARHSPSDHRAEIARTLAFTHRGAVMLTTPLALHFSKGIPLLRVLEPSDETPPVCSRSCRLADSPPQKDDVLRPGARHQSLGLAMMVGNARGERGVGARAPWPLDDRAGWIEHGWFGVGIRDPEAGRCGELRVASVSKIMGSC